MSYKLTVDHAGYEQLFALADRAHEDGIIRGLLGDWPWSHEQLETDLLEALIRLAGPEFANRYIAEPLPRPCIEVKVELLP